LRIPLGSEERRRKDPRESIFISKSQSKEAGEISAEILWKKTQE
jgi:hypothetical protein